MNDNLRTISKKIRKDILLMGLNTGNQGSHLGGSLSLVEIMAVLYTKVLNLEGFNSENRDRVILSKGHGVMAQYAAMKENNLLDEDLLTFKQDGSKLSAHPSLLHNLPGIEFASGSLGQGLSLGVGVALGLRRKKNNKSKVYVILGDGECNEGSVWEAAMSAAHFKLDNLIVIVDKNGLQYDGKTDDVMSLGSLDKKFISFGFKALTVDGHDEEELLNALNISHENQPIAIIANTIKGKGVSFIENDKTWHNKRLTKEQYEQAIAEVELEG